MDCVPHSHGDWNVQSSNGTSTPCVMKTLAKMVTQTLVIRVTARVYAFSIRSCRGPHKPLVSFGVFQLNVGLDN